MSNNDHIQSPLDYHFGSMSLNQPSASNGNAFGPMAGSGMGGNPQSASARFERFFNTGPPMGDTYGSSSFQSGLPPHRGGSPSPYGNIGGAVPSNVALGGLSGGPFAAGPSSGPSGFRARPPMSGPGPESSRGPVPSQWNAEPNLGSGALGLNAASSPISPNGILPPMNGFYAPQAFQGTPPVYPNQQQIVPPGLDLNDEDVIPTAIVVKNIPFSVKREQLLQIIEDLAIPMPYAFNYHYDQGIFRGLAFANFRSAEEADAVVAALNGFDVAGRKLRVEYKKVLQAGEKERIEKEKAIKRMRSMVMEKERMKRESGYGSGSFGAGDMLPPPLPGQGAHSAPGSDRSNIGPGPGPPKQQGHEELNLNDAQTLEIYSRVLLFKDDRMRDELAFSRNLSPVERRTVHLVAQKLNLYHYSLGDGDERHVIVAKHEVNTKGGQHRPLRSQASTIGRSNREAGHTGGFGMGGSGSNSRSGLRGKKSAPDMKRNRDSINAGLGGQGGNLNGSAFNFAGGSGSGQGYDSVNGSMSGSFMGRKSNGNLRDSYSSSALGGPGQRRSHQGGGGVGGAAGLQSLFASQFEVPPVPSLGAAYLGSAPPLSATMSNHSGSSDANFLVRSDSPLSASSAAGYSNQQQQQSGYHHHTLNGAASSGALRQPRGPPTFSGQGPVASNDIRNFGPRSRLSAQSITTGSGSSSASSHGGHSSSLNFGYDSSSNEQQ
ncbi:hypothetical protein BCV69DRAFT_193453 [Microstroma glucosiphilum]|uniref:R3H domain protein n=1 Tax=Pseudomicrostroma glucosiphilum TaxID=1684307 RepID=A0A316U5X3_9BASI|nr:hypothetical protein BCV69DRAFT_193453 [Pseudomicrostroma glucosiphilum]PWN20600.1 hypothetical protein BCV69DRAFT_193453 [Pseudomicrostroma glucosiphilum]